MSAVADSVRTLEILLPGDGCVVAFAEVYVDESYQDDSPLLCVAGYVFRRQQAREFAKSWGPYLNKRWKLPHFHMTDCAHGNEEFAHLNRNERSDIVRRLIKDTRERAAYGFAVVIDREMFDRELSGRHGLADTAYGFALLGAMIMVRSWTKRTGFSGEISYFFEDGHASRPDAERFLKLITESAANRAKYQYRTHAFLPKATHWLHPADMLAWQWRLEVVRQHQEKRTHPPRADLQALLRPHDMVMHYDTKEIAELRAEMDATYGGRTLVRPGQGAGGAGQPA